MFCEEMIDFFHKIPVASPKNVNYIKKRQMLLTDMGGKWFMKKHKSNSLQWKFQYQEIKHKRRNMILKKEKISSTLEWLEIPNSLE